MDHVPTEESVLKIYDSMRSGESITPEMGEEIEKEKRCMMEEFERLRAEVQNNKIKSKSK